MYLLNPGPVTLSNRVKNALLKVDLCHREPEFAEMQTDIRNRLIQIYSDTITDYSAVLVSGSGTAAVEMMIGSLVSNTNKALIVANGVYGERMAKILSIQHKPHILLQGDWLSEINFSQVENHLNTDPTITHVVSVHHETTTGRLNNISKLGELCKKYSKPLLLDAVSSFAGEEIQFKNWNILACAATANKCIHGVPGISFVIAKREILNTFQSAATSLYLDLKLQYIEQEKGSSPFTHAVQSCYALQEALRELEDQGGWRSRNKNYTAFSKLVFHELKALGVAPLLSDEKNYSHILLSFKIPEKFKYIDLHSFLKKNGFIIYAGQGKFLGEIFRIAVMGDLNDTIISKLTSLLREFFRK